MPIDVLQTNIKHYKPIPNSSYSLDNLHYNLFPIQ